MEHRTLNINIEDEVAKGATSLSDNNLNRYISVTKG